MKMQLALALSTLVLLATMAQGAAPTPTLAGTWKIEISFANGQSRAVQFTALSSGTGSFTAIVPKPNQIVSGEPAAAKWTRTQDSVTFSGPVQFPLGNVGIERGTLLLKGKMNADGSITGEAKFTRDPDPTNPNEQPAKSGTFKATRGAG